MPGVSPEGSNGRGSVYRSEEGLGVLVFEEEIHCIPDQPDGEEDAKGFDYGGLRENLEDPKDREVN